MKRLAMITTLLSVILAITTIAFGGMYASLALQRKEAARQLDETAEELALANDKIEKIEANLEASTKVSSELERPEESLSSPSDEKQVLVLNETKELEETKNLDEMKEELDETKTALASTKNQLDEASQALDMTKGQLEEANASIEEIKSELTEANLALGETKAQLDEANSLLKAKEEELKEADLAAAQLQSQFDETASELRIAKEQLESTGHSPDSLFDIVQPEGTNSSYLESLFDESVLSSYRAKVQSREASLEKKAEETSEAAQVLSGPQHSSENLSLSQLLTEDSLSLWDGFAEKKDSGDDSLWAGFDADSHDAAADSLWGRF